MKIFKNLKFKKPDDYKYKSIIKITTEQYKQILKEVEKGNNICLEINNNFYILKKHLGGHGSQCYSCDMLNMCLKINKKRICLVDYILEDDYYSHVFKKIDEYELVFSGEYNEYL